MGLAVAVLRLLRRTTPSRRASLRGSSPMPARAEIRPAQPAAARVAERSSCCSARMGAARLLRSPPMIQVRLRDQDGSTAARRRSCVSRSIGRSQDAGLARAEAITDADGIAENELTAGAMAASFDVRISAPGAYEKLVSVAVSNAGFGTLAGAGALHRRAHDDAAHGLRAGEHGLPAREPMSRRSDGDDRPAARAWRSSWCCPRA